MRSDPNRHHGFTLVELTIVILVLAILAALVMPKFSEATQRAEAAQIGTTMRAFAGAVQRYHAEHGTFPPDSSHGVFPPELDAYLGSFDMNETPIGGQWDYENWDTFPGQPFRIAVSIRSGDLSRFAGIDAELDDGDLGTGGIRQINLSGQRLLFGVVPR
ncbi:MAG: prepilin-type N-terminal cleavage/methylation domain-containing protein [Planctomycetota bacterium]